MEYISYIVSLLFDGLEVFFKSFTLVSGKATLRVLYFTIAYLIVGVVCKVLGKFTFLDVWSALLAVIVMFIVNSISVIKFKDITKFKSLMKGDIDNEQRQ